MENPFAGHLKNKLPSGKNHLSFEELCGYYGALMCGVENEAVALAADLAQPTVAYLRVAGEFRGGQLRYPKVAREYQTLGHDAFVHKYITPAIKDRCLAARHNIERGLARPRQSNFAKRRASGLVGRHILKPRSKYDGTTAWTIEILPPSPEGYYYLSLTSLMGGEDERQFARKFGPFETAPAALRAARDQFTPED
jgi:hypothetical protein